MGGQTPLETVEQLIEAMSGGDVERAVSLYEPGAAFVREPGKVAIGSEAIRTAWEGIAAAGLTLTTNSHQVIEAGDIALYCSDWSGSGTAPDGSSVEIGGRSADVLRRQPDGRWLIALDNPIGTAILG